MWLDHITSSGLGIDTVDTDLSFATSSTYAPTADRTRFVRGNPTRACAQLSASRPATLHPLPGDNSCVVPPDPIPNSEVERANADGSVHPHARVGHRQGLTPKPPASAGGFSLRAGNRMPAGARTVRSPGGCHLPVGVTFRKLPPGCSDLGRARGSG